MLSPAITNAQTITQVVEIVNAANRGETIEYFGGVEFRDGDQLAGHYAYDSATNAGDGLAEADFEAHLECLSDAGAVFTHRGALTETIWLKQQYFD